ncbi:MAG: pyridoxal-phosphate dependent enzyme [Bryobacteraceae bacterium]
MPSAIPNLGEGNTPLISSVRTPSLLFKLENCNPSGSYKDRFASAEVARLVSEGATACLATSSGNTGSALAAYCARADVRCMIFVNKDAPAGKLAQMQAHGANVVRVAGFAASMAVTRSVFAGLFDLSQEFGAPLVVSAYRFCPVGMSSVEGISRELCAQYPGVRHVFVPVGGGGLFSAVCRGFLSQGRRDVKVHAVQPAGCLTTVASFLRGDSEIRDVESTTRVSGLSVPDDIDASLALSLLRESGGQGIAVTDEEVFAAQAELLSREGVYCEPAGATALAGYLQARRDGFVSEDETSVCLVTGHGFKDPVSIERTAAMHPSVTIEPGEVRETFLRLR